jgi:hypothetical protein
MGRWTDRALAIHSQTPAQPAAVDVDFPGTPKNLNDQTTKVPTGPEPAGASATARNMEHQGDGAAVTGRSALACRGCGIAIRGPDEHCRRCKARLVAAMPGPLVARPCTTGGCRGVAVAAEVECIRCVRPQRETAAPPDVDGPHCPQCERPLDPFDCCWPCRQRLCQQCGEPMPKPFAIHCDSCLAARFAALDEARRAS